MKSRNKDTRRLKDIADPKKMSVPELLALRADMQNFKHVLGSSVSSLGEQIEVLTAEIKARQGKRFEVTDHAVVQYMSRVMGIDVEAIRQKMAEILSSGVPTTHLKSDAKAYEAGGVIFVVARKGKVVTVYPLGEAAAIVPDVVDAAIQIEGGKA